MKGFNRNPNELGKSIREVVWRRDCITGWLAMKSFYVISFPLRSTVYENPQEWLTVDITGEIPKDKVFYGGEVGWILNSLLPPPLFMPFIAGWYKINLICRVAFIFFLLQLFNHGYAGASPWIFFFCRISQLRDFYF